MSNSNVNSATTLSVVPSQSNIIPFDASTLSVKQLIKLGYTRSKIVKIKHLKPHSPVMPIKSLEDIQKCKEYFLKQPSTYRSTNTNIRNYCMFVVGINIANRVHDLVNLRIKNVMNPDRSIKDSTMIIESKTGKTKKVYFCKNAKEALDMYLKTKKSIDMEDYLFTSKKCPNESLTENGFWRVMKTMSKNVGIKDNIGSHSLRKTFGYQAIVHNPSSMTLSKVMKEYNHSNLGVSLNYFGITDDTMRDFHNENQL